MRSDPLRVAARRGFTLLELLLVVVLMGAVVVTIATRMPGVGRERELAAVVAAVQRADRESRLRARLDHAAVRVELRADGWYRRLEDGRWRAAYRWPEGYRVRAEGVAGPSLRRWSYDAEGRGPDLHLRVRGPGRRGTRLVVAGLSGQWVEDAP